MTTSDKARHEFVIPTIDIAPYLSNPCSQESTKLIDDVKQACVTTGFFSLVGHDIPRDLQQRVLRASEMLFALPQEKKVALVPQNGILRNRGYEIIGSQVLQEGALPDLKEGFFVGRHIPTSDERSQLHPQLMGENIFPSDMAESDFKQPLETYYEAVLQLALKVLKILAQGLPYGEHVFDDFISNDPYCNVRLLHYPPQTSKNEKQLGAGAHTDFGAITLLYQDMAGGLEVLNHSTGEWIPVEPNPDAYVVNIGDMLSIWTKDVYKSNVHRVINISDKDRYSVPFFFDGNLDVRLEPLDGSKALAGNVLTVEEHMLKRLGASYGRAEQQQEAVGP